MLLTHCCVCVSMARLIFFYIESCTWSSSISDFTVALRRQGWLHKRTRSVSLCGRFLSCEIIIQNKGFRLFLHVFRKSSRVVGSVLDPKYVSFSAFCSKYFFEPMNVFDLCSRKCMNAYKIPCKMSVVFCLLQLKAFCFHRFY
jgi:hypothetical protein